jgi:hypothetical protein
MRQEIKLTRKTLKIWICVALGYLILLLIVGIDLFVHREGKNSDAFEVFDKMIPIFLALAVACLGFCFQQREHSKSWGRSRGHR